MSFSEPESIYSLTKRFRLLRKSVLKIKWPRRTPRKDETSEIDLNWYYFGLLVWFVALRSNKTRLEIEWPYLAWLFLVVGVVLWILLTFPRVYDLCMLCLYLRQVSFFSFHLFFKMCAKFPFHCSLPIAILVCHWHCYLCLVCFILFLMESSLSAFPGFFSEFPQNRSRWKFKLKWWALWLNRVEAKNKTCTY